MRTDRLDLADIQGNILRGYRTPLGLYLFYRFDEPAGGRRFVSAIADEVTTAVEWDGGKPDSTLNVAFTFDGLGAIGVAAEALDAFPLDFRQGMLARARSLGDFGESDPAMWEPFWRSAEFHVLLLVGAGDAAALERRCDWLDSVRKLAGAVVEAGRQDAGALVIDGKVTNKEHFGFSDGYGNPQISGTGLPLQPGSGKPTANGWAPVAPGELLLGHRNEQGELAPTPPPFALFRNGTFLVYRKLHQKVGTFRQWLADEGARTPGGPEMLAAKMVGRWRDGTPLMLSPDAPDPSIVADDNRVVNFRYADDPHGVRCPLGAHIRRSNPRDAFGFGTALTAGRRIMRRGLPYGSWTPDDEPGDDDAEHGTIFMVLNASIKEQFEFVVQQWLNYGNDFLQGNDPDPLLGNRAVADKMVIPGDPTPGGRPPHVCFGMPQFVVTRGGAYFFLPSITALRWMTRSQDAVKASLIAVDERGDDGASYRPS